jgi:hypothetical protein
MLLCTEVLASFKSTAPDAPDDRVRFAVIADEDTGANRYIHYTPGYKYRGQITIPNNSLPTIPRFGVGSFEVFRDAHSYTSKSDIESMIEVVRGADEWIEITEGEE